MRVAVLGAGAIGAYVGAALARGGTDVHLIARRDNLEAIRANGVKVLSDRGDFEAHPPATDDPSEIGPVDFVFLGLKANSYATAASCSTRSSATTRRSSRPRTASRGGTSTASTGRTPDARSRPSTRAAPSRQPHHRAKRRPRSEARLPRAIR